MFEDEDTGGTLAVHSRGQFSNILDLDKTDYVKVCMRRRAQVGYWQCTVVDSSLIYSTWIRQITSRYV